MLDNYSHASELIKLRKRVIDAVNAGVIDDENKGIYEATLIQILNESERQRQKNVLLKEDFLRKAAAFEAKAEANVQMSQIIYNVLNSYVAAAERAKPSEEEVVEKEHEDNMEKVKQRQAKTQKKARATKKRQVKV